MVWNAAQGTNSTNQLVSASPNYICQNNDLRGVMCPLNENSTSVEYIVSFNSRAPEVLVIHTSQITFLMERSKGSHIIDHKTVGLNGCVEALQAIPSHIPKMHCEKHWQSKGVSSSLLNCNPCSLRGKNEVLR